MFRIPAAVLLALLMAVPPAQAHRLKVFATLAGDRVEGRAYFVGGAAAGGVAVSLVTPDNVTVAEGRTGEDGAFSLAAPPKSAVTIVVDTRDGHVARFPIAASGIDAAGSAPSAAAPAPAAGTPGVDPAVLEAIVARQIGPLQAQIDELSTTLRLHDILGGLGWIAGIFGLVAWLGRKRRPAP